MTAKSRTQAEGPVQTYSFRHGIKDILIEAQSLLLAQRKFQEQYGYWPE